LRPVTAIISHYATSSRTPSGFENNGNINVI
jgi:hypothetical protein